MKYLLLISLLLHFEVWCNQNKEMEEGDEFQATEEWQVIKKGQKVPKGLHYRINLETGSTEAKLLEQEKSEEKKDVLAVSSQNKNQESNLEDIKEALKNIKDDGKPGENINLKFRSYEQIKKAINKLNLTTKVDAEIIGDLLKEHKNELKKETLNVDRVINILEDFDYLSHQFDNGLLFVNKSGFRDVIYKNLNCSSDKIKSSTLRLFGSLVQNNAKVQIHALDTGSLTILLRILSSDFSSETLKNSAMFALSCLLRRFPLAQHRFVENGGTYIILKLFKKSSLKIQLKVTILLTDLFVEKRQAESDSNQELIIQYNIIDLENQLVGQNWCILIDKLLYDIVNTNPEDHDSIEKVLIGMQIIVDKCKSFNRQLLTNLKIKYEELSELETVGDNFYKEIVKICSEILLYKIEKNEL